MRIEDIDIELIDITKDRRVVDPDWVQTLAKEFLATRQEREIDVVETGPRFRLIAGRHRLEAAKIAGIPVKAKVYAADEFADEAAMKLAEISENFMRRELSVLDQAFDVAAWRAIYERAAGAVKPGKRAIGAKSGTNSIGGKSAPNSDEVLDAQAELFAASFSEAAQAAFKFSRRAVFRALKIASIPQPIRERISLHRIAANQSELLVLAAEPAERQSAIAGLLLAEPPAVHSVADAIAILDRVPAPAKPEPWARLSDQFSKLPEPAKRRFITENWDFIETMMAEKDAA